MNHTIIHVAIACAMTALLSGCDRSHRVSQAPLAVVEAAQSLGPWSTPPSYTTTEVVPDQEWSVVIIEGIAGQKFEHHEITIQIRRVNADQTEVAITAFRISSLLPKQKVKAGRVARRYAGQLAEKLKEEKSDSSQS